MAHFLYILYSEKAHRYYVGETYDMHQRVAKHNNHKYAGAFTKTADDWTERLIFECQTREDALFLERFIKRMKSRKFIENLIQQPNMLHDILTKKP